LSRYASSTNQTEGDKARIGMFIACALDFSSGFVRAHNAIGDYTWGGNTYNGVGKFGGIEVAEESMDMVPRAITLTLSGVDSSLISTATTENYQGRAATLFMGLVNLDTNALIDTPETLRVMRMNQMTIILGEQSSIQLSLEQRMRMAPRVARNTDADLKLLYSSARFFDLLPKIPLFHGTWGTKGAANDGGASPSTPPGWRTPYKP